MHIFSLNESESLRTASTCVASVDASMSIQSTLSSEKSLSVLSVGGIVEYSRVWPVDKKNFSPVAPKIAFRRCILAERGGEVGPEYSKVGLETAAISRLVITTRVRSPNSVHTMTHLERSPNY
eukprot:916449_1